MGEVIKGNFGKKIENPEEIPDHSSKEVSAGDKEAEEAGASILRAREAEKQGDERAQDLTKLVMSLGKATSMLNHIRGLRGVSISNEVDRIATEHWSKTTNDSLVNAVTSSGSADWSKYPGRYKALARELVKRVEAIETRFKE
jgi:uncharacterized protein YPO0396